MERRVERERTAAQVVLARSAPYGHGPASGAASDWSRRLDVVETVDGVRLKLEVELQLD